MPEDEQNIANNFLKGKATIDDTDKLIDTYNAKYSQNKCEDDLVSLLAYKELQWRLKTSVFSANGNRYPISFRKYCIKAEFHNTQLFIKLIVNILESSTSIGDFTKAGFYGQPEPGYIITRETLIHILLRHNQTINNFLNPDSKGYSRSPSSFEFGAIGPVMLRLFMILNAVNDGDWKKTQKGKNKFVCHVNCGGIKYTIVATDKKEIISFYPRIDDLDVEYVELIRHTEQMKFSKIGSID